MTVIPFPSKPTTDLDDRAEVISEALDQITHAVITPEEYWAAEYGDPVWSMLAIDEAIARLELIQDAMPDFDDEAPETTTHC